MSWNLLDISTLRRIALFNGVSDDALVEILTVTDTRRLKPGEIIFEEGDPGDALYFLLEGEVRIFKDISGAGEEALAFLSAGTSFGEMALIEDNATRSANAVSGSDCHLGIIPRLEFTALMESNAELSSEILWSFVATLSSRLRNSNEKLAFFALSDRDE